jgi:peptidoglycan/LPS O-acetylase OafA/YrhL
VGLVRILLAAAVVTDHVGRGRFMVGGNAVSAFFVISGFYMSLVLRSKYPANRSGRIAFWKSRIVRLYPSYWIVLLLAGSGRALFKPSSLATFHMLGAFWKTLVVLSQITMLGQDAITFTGIDATSHALYPINDLAQVTLQGWSVLVIPQAWSLSIEIMFYLIAPFVLVRSFSWVGGFFLGFVLLRLAAKFAFHLGGELWDCRFFPFELNLFLAGALAHQFYERFQGTSWFRKELGYVSYPLIVCLIYTLGKLASSEAAGLTVAACLPFLFHATRSLRLDRWIGELSYPLYICHWSLLTLYRGTGGSFAFYLACCFAVSALLLVFVDLPLDRIRQKMVRNAMIPVGVG